MHQTTRGKTLLRAPRRSLPGTGVAAALALAAAPAQAISFSQGDTTLDIKAHVGFAPGINDKSDVVGLFF